MSKKLTKEELEKKVKLYKNKVKFYKNKIKTIEYNNSKIGFKHYQ